MRPTTPPQITARDDRWMINNPEEWPQWPFLPVKNPELIRKLGFSSDQGDQAFGVILAYTDKKHWLYEKVAPVIVHLNVFDLPKAPNNTFKYLLENFPKTKFESLDALLAAGWVVD